MRVPNQFPRHGDSKICLIGEAPGFHEAERGIPFVGATGYHLDTLLRISGISRESCFVGNICQHRPEGNDISLFEWDGAEIQEGLEALRTDLESYRPNIVVLMGNVALKASKDPDSNHPLITKLYRFKNKDWRGSLMAGGGIFTGLKCLPTYHPAFALRKYDVNPLIVFDLTRARSESVTPELVLPKRDLIIGTNFYDVCQFLQRVRDDHIKTAVDIEGYLYRMSCIALATSPLHAFIIPFILKSGARFWTEFEEKIILRELCHTMMDGGCSKVFQNGLYDRFVLQYSYNIPVNGNTDDTMLKSWELNCELPKSLAVQTSIYTKEPFYKMEGRDEEWDGK